MLSAEIEIINKLGLHARASGQTLPSWPASSAAKSG